MSNTFHDKNSSASPCSVSIEDAWEGVINNVADCVAVLRKRKGCEDAVMRVIVETSNRFHVYSTHERLNSSSPGKNAPKEGSEMLKRRTFELSNTGNIVERKKDEITTISEALGVMSMTELRNLCSEVRKLVGLTTFIWPEKAQIEYNKTRGEGAPPPPGREGCTKERLTTILNICALFADLCRESMYKALQSTDVHGSQECESPEAGDRDDKQSANHRSDPGNGTNDFSDRQIPNNDDNSKRNRGTKGAPPHSENQATAGNTAKIAMPWWPREGDARLSVIMIAARGRPQDTRRVNTVPRLGPDIGVLIRNISYMEVPDHVKWFVQNTPGDGNCLFYAVIISAFSRSVILNSLGSAVSLRKALKQLLKELSLAERRSSRFRREWLVACNFDMEDADILEFGTSAAEKAKLSYDSKDIEILLQPLRTYVDNGAEMVGRDHWGGKLTAELRLLATITGCALELFKEVGNGVNGAIEMCDMRRRGGITKFVRTAIYLPSCASLPCGDEQFSLSDDDLHENPHGWVGNHPVLRLVLEGEHYSACTSKCFNAIPPLQRNDMTSPLWKGYDETKTLSQPYADLSTDELPYFEQCAQSINVWRTASSNCSVASRHADNMVFNTRQHHITVSQLSTLEVASVGTHSQPQNRMLSDDLVSCYMHLLQKRHESIAKSAAFRREESPPLSYYMNGWFYPTIARGTQGTASIRGRKDLLLFSQLLIPAWVQGHWLLAICYRDAGIIGVYDPLGRRREDVFRVVKGWAEQQLS